MAKLQKSMMFFILDNPFIEKSYQKLYEYYLNNKMNYEADCLFYLINNKFTNANNSDTSKK